MAGVIDLYERAVGGAATETLFWESPESKNTYDWSLDGKWIVYAAIGVVSQPDASRWNIFDDDDV